MSGTALMTVGVRAMSASYAALQTTSNNIANASVEGYSRQKTILATAPGQYTGAGFFGRGVDVKSIERTHNAFLAREAAATRSLASLDETRLYQLHQLESIFKHGEQGLGSATSQLLNSMSDLAARPADGATREVVLARAAERAARFAESGRNFDAIQLGVKSELTAAVDSVNNLAGQIAKVNGAIAAARGLGQPPNHLLDERDRLIREISRFVQVSTLPADDGTVSVFVGGGQRLVLGDSAEQLTVMSDRFDSSRQGIGIIEGGAPARRLKTDTLGAGSMAGLLRFQNEDLAEARTLVGQLAVALGSALNAQQQLGMNLRQPVGSVPSQALFAYGEPVALPADTNARGPGGEPVTPVTLTVTDASQLRASEYLLKPDTAGAPGSYLLTRLSDGRTSTITSGQEVDGMRIDIGPPDAAPTDQFLLQPVTRGGDAMRALLSDPLDLAAASPQTADTPSTNTGTVAVSALTMSSTPLDRTATATITFTSSSGAYSWDLVDALGAPIAGGTGNWVAGQPIPAPPDGDINGFQVTFTGVPASGDVIEVVPTTYPESNNGNALALAALRDIAIVGRTLQSDGTYAGGLTSAESWVAALADVGVRIEGAEASAAISDTLATQAEMARANSSGVNLDEEAARLMQFQQSYQAAAKVLQVAQSVFDTLLNTVSG